MSTEGFVISIVVAYIKKVYYMENINYGLEGVVVNTTAISYIDGIGGQLVYRGYNIEELTNLNYEQVVYLLMYGNIPDAAQTADFMERLASVRQIPNYLINIMKEMPKETEVIDAVRTTVSALNLHGMSAEDTAIQLISKLPVITAMIYNVLNNKSLVSPKESLSHSANFLYMLHGGKEADPLIVNALDKYLITTADHGMNASTFTARVVSSTESDMVSAIVAAIGALKGPLHGGAPSEVEAMLNEIGTIKNIEPWLLEQIHGGKRIMGFGHRVYKTYDPRSMLLREAVKAMGSKFGNLALSLALEEKAVELLETHKPGRNLYPNVEFWAAAILRVIDLPHNLYTPTFGIGRVSGWCIQVMEQMSANRLIRPSVKYTGVIPPKYTYSK